MSLTGRQTIFDYQDASRDVGFGNDNGIDDYMAMKADIESLSQQVDSLSETILGLSPQFGIGSPEGVVTSNINRTYFDTSGVNATMYINENIGTDTGWQEVN